MILLELALLLATLASDEFCTQHLKQQREWHVKYGLPLPPPDAVLVKYVSEPRRYYRLGKVVTEPGSPGLAFSIDGGTLWNDRGEPDPVASIKCVKPEAALIGDVLFARNLEIAIVAHERGWKPLALAAIRQWTLLHGGWDTEDVIARDAWNHWKRRLHGDPDTPLSVVAKYLKRAHGRHGGDLELARCLELALTPRNSPPGSDNALIDDLVGLRGEQPFDITWASSYRCDPRYRAVVRRGLDAVPALIAHLEDDRITRAIRRREGLDNIENLRVKDIAFDILVQLRGGPFVVEEDNMNERLKAIGKWYAEATKLGEGKYLASRLLGEDADDREFRATLFWLLTDRYPDRVPDVFRAVIDTRPEQRRYSWTYSKAIHEGPLPPPEKQKIFEYAARHESAEVRWAGIKFLRTVEPKLARELLLEALATLPAEPDKTEAMLAYVVAECADPDEWKALSLAVRRATAEGRLDLLDVVTRAKTPEGRKHRLAFLAEYLTDDEVNRDQTYRHVLPWLEVRNSVALRLARLLDVDVEPEEDWTAAQWAGLRARVRTRVQEELRR